MTPRVASSDQFRHDPTVNEEIPVGFQLGYEEPDSLGPRPKVSCMYALLETCQSSPTRRYACVAALRYHRSAAEARDESIIARLI